MSAIITISILAIILLFLGAINRTKPLLPLLYLGLTTAFALSLSGWNQAQHLYNDMYIGDNFSIAFNAVLIIATLLICLFIPVYYKGVKRSLEDIYALILFSLAGALAMTSFGNLVMLFLGIETLSIALYILAGSKKYDPNSNEAAMKYFLMGSFASGFLLFGIALLYGACGSFNLTEVKAYVAQNASHLPLMFIGGMLLILLGMIFKVGAAPFHFWSPDVYEGSPTLVTTFMATVGKIAAIAALFRLMNSCLLDVDYFWKGIFALIAVLTIVVGNFSALFQSNFKRLLAYSGIAHAGYMLIALVSLKAQVAGVLLLYSFSYIVSSVTAFAVLMMIRQATGSFEVNSFKGLAKNNKPEALALTLSMLSLAGIPPLIGFASKYNLFIKALETGNNVPLVIIAVIGSMVSLYYYFRPVMVIYSNPEETSAVRFDTNYRPQIMIALVLLVISSLVPIWLVNLI
jgi:proton-translocating NADH-quinone oxidoreductase, chain N